jgi:hypothetical protein
MTTSTCITDMPSPVSRNGAIRATHILMLLIGIAMGYVAVANQSPPVNTFDPAIEKTKFTQSEDWHGNVRRSHYSR